MKLVYGDIGHVMSFEHGYVVELVIENKPLFFRVVNDISMQADGLQGDVVLSIHDKPVELSRYIDLNLQFAPFEINRKSVLTKLSNALEKQAVSAELYLKTQEILSGLELLVQEAASDFSFEVDCSKVSIGPIFRTIGIEIAERNEAPLEKIFSYMEIVRELDKDRLFVMVNMRTYFSNDEMNRFIESVCLHDFKVLLLENVSFAKLPNVKRYTVDEDLCEF